MSYLKVILLCIVLSVSNVFAQKVYAQKGNIELGLRTTSSVFGHDGYSGLGVGGQTRVQITDYLNTEWFADYPKKMGKFIPYIIAGHCFDYAKVTPFSTPYLDRSHEELTRWSSAVQMGLGSHYYFNDKFNLTFSAQYMMHLGKHLEYELLKTETGYYLETDHDEHANERLESHVLFTVSLNYKIVDLW